MKMHSGYPLDGPLPVNKKGVECVVKYNISFLSVLSEWSLTNVKAI